MNKVLWGNILEHLINEQICTKGKAQNIEIPQYDNQIFPILRKELGDEILVHIVRRFTNLKVLGVKQIEQFTDGGYKGTHNEDIFYLSKGYAFISNPFDTDLQKLLNKIAGSKFKTIAYCGLDIKATVAWEKAELLTASNDIDVYADGDSKAKRIINDILRSAKSMNVSDIHIDPTLGEKVIVKVRQNKSLVSLTTYPLELHDSVQSQLFNLTDVRLQRLKSQDAAFEYTIDKQVNYYRMGRLPVKLNNIDSGKIAIRRFDSSANLQTIQGLGLSQYHADILKKAASKASGIVIVTGPTGSGKSTMLWAGLRHCMEVYPDKSFYGVEDPIEQQVEGVTQIGIDNINITFIDALKGLMRMDPDVILLGEIRDGVTAQVAVDASMTGHMVLTTLHVNNCHKTVDRLKEMGVEPSIIADSAVLFSAQRLVKRLCEDCKQPVSIHEIEDSYKYIPFLSKKSKGGVKPVEVVYEPQGCSKCKNTGYKGLSQIMEMLEVNGQVEDAILSGAPMSQFRRNSIKEGTFYDFWQDGLDQVKKGTTTIAQLNSALKPIEDDHPYLIADKIKPINSLTLQKHN